MGALQEWWNKTAQTVKDNYNASIDAWKTPGKSIQTGWEKTKDRIGDYQFAEGTQLRQLQDAEGFGGKLQSGIGALTSGINGLTSIWNNFNNAATINDTPEFDQQVENINALGNVDYDSYNQILSGYQMLNQGRPYQTFDKVRGMTDTEKAFGVGSSILSGASSGFDIGGLPGAAVGAFTGFLGGIWGNARGDEKARNEVMRDNLDAQIAMDNAYTNLQAETEDVRDRIFRNAYSNIGARGGQIKRQMDVREYASKVLGKRSPVYMPTREYCKGGLKVRIKVR